jgi:hypothetical protein
MPTNIIRFERLAYGSIAVVVVSWVWFVKDDVSDLLFALPFIAIFTLLWIALIWVTARRRRNWGRWLYSALIVSGVALEVLLDPTFKQISAALHMPPNPIAADVASVVYDLMAIASVYFLFAGDAALWFRRRDTMEGGAEVQQ